MTTPNDPAAAMREAAAKFASDEASMALFRSETCSEDMAAEYCFQAEYASWLGDAIRALPLPAQSNADALREALEKADTIFRHAFSLPRDEQHLWLFGDEGIDAWQLVRGAIHGFDHEISDDGRAALEQTPAQSNADALREALWPFVMEASEYDDGDGDPDLRNSPDQSSLNEANDLTVGDLRRARQLWSKLGYEAAAVGATAPATAPTAVDKARSSVKFHQMRGRMLDAVDWAINEYDQYMLDDRYDAQNQLDTIITRMRQVREETQDSASITRAALEQTPVQDSDEETYQIGKRDGYEEAVAEIDRRTGGDGEYFASTLPGRGCPDPQTMIANIEARFAALQTPVQDLQVGAVAGEVAKYAEMDTHERANAMADDCVGDPWELLGYFREMLRQSESARAVWKERAMQLRTPPASTAAVAGEAEGLREYEAMKNSIAEVINEDGGCWHSCSGCQESVDGYVSSRDYPYSPIFQCQPGAGCRECGGLGVLWEDGEFLRGYSDALATEPANAAGDTFRELIEDAMPILDVLIDDREARIGEECEIARDLRDRFAAALATPPASTAALAGEADSATGEALVSLAKDFRQRAIWCRTVSDAYDDKAASVWDFAAEAVEAKL